MYICVCVYIYIYIYIYNTSGGGGAEEPTNREFTKGGVSKGGFSNLCASLVQL